MNEFIEMALKPLALIGVVTVICIIGVVVMLIFMAIGDLADKIKHNYSIKHRFDKGPVAKCFCKDCKNWGSETGVCYRFEQGGIRWYTADCWFCWDADPKEKVEE